MDSNILVDQSHASPAKVPMAANHLADPGTGGFMTMMRSRHMSLNSHSSLSQLLSSTNYHYHHGFSSSPVHPLPPQPMIYASLPSITLPLVQPPLLPLPSAKAAAPKTTSRSANTGGGRMMKPKAAPASTPRKATSNYSRPREQKEQPRKTVESDRSNVEKEEEGEEETLNMESIYSLSPPPSNLPLPRFLLTRHKIASSDERRR